MINSNLKFRSLRNNQDFQYIDISDIEDHILNPYKSMRWGVYGIIWTGSSSYRHKFDKVYDIPANHFLFISPYKKNSFVEGKHPDAVLILFNSVFYERSTREAFTLHTSPLFHKTDEVYFYENCIYSSEDLRVTASKILDTASNSDKGSLYNDLAHSIVSIIILFAMTQVKKDVKRNFKYALETKDSDSIVCLRFKELVFKHYKSERSISFYADLLNISDRKLTSMCKDTFDKSAKEIITETVYNSALRMLSNSDLSVKEITYDLGFSEETNFIAFFRKHSGLTPHNFRKMYNKHRLFAK